MFGLEDETRRRVLNTLKFVNAVFGASSQETVAVVDLGQYVRADGGLGGLLGEDWGVVHNRSYGKKKVCWIWILDLFALCVRMKSNLDMFTLCD